MSAALKALKLNKNAGRPKHERLRDYLAGELAAQRLKPGDALPTELELASTLTIARSTVRQALAALERDGLIRRVQGKGTFVRDDAPQQIAMRRGLFALITPEIRSGFYPSLLRGFEEAARERQGQVLVSCSENDLGKQADLVLQLLDKQVTGVAIVPTTLPPTPAHQLRPFHRQGVPIVFCHRRVEGLRAPLLAIPFEDVGRMAGQRLAEAGHRRVAYLALHRATSSLAYEQGLRLGLREAGVDLPMTCVQYGNCTSSDPAEQEAEIERLLESVINPAARRPTALFVGYDPVAEMIYLMLSRRGLRVPEDITLIGFGGAWREGAMTRRLSSVTVDETDVGRQALALLDRMSRGELPIDHEETLTLPLGFSRGETLAAPPGVERRNRPRGRRETRG